MASSFAPTQDELGLVTQVFAIADPQKIGIVTGEAAVKVFTGAKLSPTVLGEIWNIADADNNGFLSKKGVAIALRLIGWAQKGEKVTAALVNKSGPLPNIDGITPVAQHNTGFPSAPKSPPPLGGLPAFTPQDRAKFLRMFQSSGPVNGFLSAEKARDIFVKSKLPLEKLSQIWNLADTQDRGMLDSTDFAIGMYFIQAAMSSQLPFLPTSLPPGLYDQAAGRGVATHNTGASITPHLTGNLPHRSPVQPQYTGIQPQYTGQSQTARIPSRPVTSALGASAFGTFAAPSWDITDAEKANADRLFDNLDTHKRGFIEGDVAVPFMLESKLPGDDLAKIWDLADLHNDGRLTRDGFAVAMHLIQGKLSGKDIPTALPPSLVPPSMRSSSVIQQPPPPKAPEPQIDLLWGDDSPPSIPAALPTLSPQPTAQSSTPQPSAIKPSSPPPALRSPPTHDPFGTKFPAANDFLSDDHDTTASRLQDKSAEIGNVQNILSSTNRSLEATKTDKAELEGQLESQTAQLAALQTQLSSAKAAYENETRLLATLRERYNNQQAEIQKTREELIRAESDLSAVRVEKAEIEGAFLRDKEEARELHRKMIEAGQQAEALKLEVEKVKKEAKQQKGRLAIARKQLSTKEADKAKVEKELEEAKEELTAALKEVEETEAEIAKVDAVTLDEKPAQPLKSTSSDTLAFAAATALPLSPDITGVSSVSSPSKSNNPFERLGLSPAATTPRSQSPFTPFANNSTIISPQEEKDEKESDPFSFQDAFGAESETKPSQSPIPPAASIASTPKQLNTEITVPARAASPNGITPASPMSEMDSFTTPPSTAIAPSTTSSPAPVTAVAAAVEESSEKFPELKPDTIPGRQPTEAENETDLSSQLKEIEVDESDSSDEDDVPLATLKGKDVEKANVNPTVEPATQSAAGFSFDDAFGSGGFAPATEPAPAVKDAFGIPTSPKSGGVGEFDEAMSKITSTNTNSTTPAPFSFDTAFDDNFDFGNSFTPTPAPAPAPAAVSTTQTTAAPASNASFPSGASIPTVAVAENGNATSDFDAIFSPLNNVSIPEPIKDHTAGTSVNGAGKNSFDNAFGITESPRVSTSANAPPPESEATSDPTSPKEPKSPAYDRRASPSPAPVSPPPRVASPVSHGKPRLSTSSKESADKAPPARHSKLSLRLPFGKKKKTADAPPPPSRSQLLTPPREEGNGTPAVDDDIEPVKQLCGMGFSRTQAVTALENHNYDVQRALNSLLGTQ